MINDVDGRPAFERFCRQPHTRINYIMEMIDKGGDDHMVAAAFEMDIKTARVYRMAHVGTPCKIATGIPWVEK